MSLTDMKLVPQDLLQDRLEIVKELESTETEAYAIQKDRVTGEHYLHYAYVHLNIADGQEETYNYLMPLENDDVLAVIFGEQLYAYPDKWNNRFLRNGPSGQYVWFDPSSVDNDQDYEQMGSKLADLLTEFKKNGQFDEQSVRNLLKEIDRNTN